jgi:WD40 repeat protein
VAVIALVVVIIALGRRTPSPRPEVVVQATLPESKDTPVSREDTAPKSTKTTKETRPAQPVPPPGPVTELAGHAGGTLAIACSSDGTLVLTGGADGMVRLWDARTGQELFRCEGHKGPVTGVALASNDRLVSGSQDRTVRIWDRWGGKLMFTVTDYPGPVRSLAVSQKEDRLLTAGWGTEVWLQDLGRAQGIPFGHSVPVTCVAFSPDGKSFLAGTDSGSGPDDNAVVLWNIEKRTQVWRGRGHTRPVRSVAFSADGSRAVSASDDRTVRIWSVEKGTEVQCLEGHRTAVVGAAFTPEQLVVSAGGPSVIVWDPVTETDVRHVEVPNREAAQLAIAFPGSKVFLADRRAAPVVLLELPPRDQLVKSAPEPVGEVRRYTSHTAEVRRLAVSPRGRTLLAASRDGLIHVYNVRTGQEVRQLKGHTGPVNAVAFCPDGTQVLSGGQDGTARLWDLETGKELQQLKDLEEVLSIAVSPDGEQAAVAGVGSAVVLWDLVEDEEIRQLEHTGGVNCVRYSSEGNRLVSAGTNRVLHLWDPDTGQNLASFKGHLGRIYSAAFSPNGQMLLSGGEDATVRLWDVGSAKEVRRFHGANGSVYAVAFSADGSLALAAGTDREIFLWETGKGQAAPPLQGHKGLIWDAVFSPDGRYAYSAGGGEDTSVRRWHLPPRTEYVVVPIEKPPIRLPVPAEEVRKAAIANVQEKYRTHVKHTRQSDLDLAGRVLQAGLNATGDPEYQYALLHQARFVYARCGMVTEALQAVEELGKVFQIDSLEERTITLELLSNASSAEPGTPRALVDRALVEFEEALAADEYKIADRLLDVAEKMVRTIARTTAYTNYNKQVRDRRDRLEPLLKEYPAIKQALDTLAANKEDAPANLKLGQFYCFHKQDWSKGIPHLARGSDTVLSALAGKELVPPKTGPDMLQVADGWSKQAESVPEPIRLTLQKRAYHWYLRALSDLTGAEENRAESRIDALGKQVPGLKTRWDFYDIGPLDPTLDPLRLKAGQEIATRHCYQGPIEITTVVERPSLKSGSCGLQLSAFRSLSVVFLWTAKGGEVRVSRPDKEHPQGVQVFRKEEIPVKGKFRSQLCWRIGEDNMDLLFDGAPIYSEKGEKLDLSTRHPVRLGVKEGALGVKSLSVISKSKPASKE